jgi:hypothetical protein
VTNDIDQDDATNRPAMDAPEARLRQVVRATQAQLAAILVDLEQQPDAPFIDREWAFFQTLATALQSYADASRRASQGRDGGRPHRAAAETDPDATPLWWLEEPTPEDGER